MNNVELRDNPIICEENIVYEEPETLKNVDMHYCPGCGHGVVHRLIAEVIEEMGYSMVKLLELLQLGVPFLLIII